MLRMLWYAVLQSWNLLDFELSKSLDLACFDLGVLVHTNTNNKRIVNNYQQLSVIIISQFLRKNNEMLQEYIYLYIPIYIYLYLYRK